MKKMKRLVALALSVVMVLAMSVVAFAADNSSEATGTTLPTGSYSITIDNTVTGHTYEAYQVFAGDLSGGTLSNIIWGTGIDTTKEGQTALSADDAKTKAEALKTADNAKAFAQEIAPYLENNAKYTSVVEGDKYVIKNLPAGYYLVKDADNSLTSKDDFYTAYIMEVVGNVTASPKGEKPTVEKKVEENTKYKKDDGYGAQYNDVADYNIGDEVPFKLIGSVPDMSKYSEYKYNFVDILSNGLDLNAETVEVYVSSDKKGTDKKEISGYTVEPTTSPKGFKVIFANLKNVKDKKTEETIAVDGKYIIVEYKATLNSNAVVGLPGNPNEVYLEYSNNPNNGGEGSTGETPKDKVIVFTYKLNVKKVDGLDENKPLKDAEFKLYRGTDGNIEWAQVEETTGKVKDWVKDEKNATTLKSNSEGVFKVVGLDDGIYYLKETKAPDGYNLLDAPIKLEIKATTTITPTEENGKQDNQNWAGNPSDALTALVIKVDNGKEQPGVLENTGEDKDLAGSVSVTVKNNQGSTLPSTGGIGTTIFYIVGGILMVGAAVLLITKRRAEN